MSAFKQKEVEVGGVKYTIQKLPFKAYLEMEDRCTNARGILLKANYLAELFKHCVIKPKKVTLDTFDDDFDSALELSNEIERFHKSKHEQAGADQDQNPEEGEG